MDRAYTFQVKKVENNKFLKRKDSLKIILVFLVPRERFIKNKILKPFVSFLRSHHTFLKIDY